MPWQEGWILQVYEPDDEVKLTSLGVHVPVSALYELTDVPEIQGGIRAEANGHEDGEALLLL
jgi:hypothetical protein